MAAAPPSSDRIRFGPFVVDPAAGELWRGEARLRIQDLPLRLLVALLERPGEVRTRAELTQRLWGDGTFVDAVSGLNTAVAKLREVLEDDAERPVYIETVPKRGYRFIGRIDGVAASAPRPPASKRIALWGVIALAAVLGIGVVWLRSGAAPVRRVAVVLFDNETDTPELDRLAQGLTDATVFALTARPELEVIGNAAVLRTGRPFRELERIRDAVHADYIVIGQVQSLEGATHVRTHLIRAADLAHVWVENFPDATIGEVALQAAVSRAVAEAVPPPG